ncbi:hypothetical protein TREES_T100000903 [Tupaia chinensis]|uniref:Uncharacterized protein n=1 Tax=Tupaia chinensis TaxID=246437 RepID=L9JEP2_TUPCH|nr:hypothetical protein TREES_T100000903 [Tupaia chinensis]
MGSLGPACDSGRQGSKACTLTRDFGERVQTRKVWAAGMNALYWVCAGADAAATDRVGMGPRKCQASSVKSQVGGHLLPPYLQSRLGRGEAACCPKFSEQAAKTLSRVGHSGLRTAPPQALLSKALHASSMAAVLGVPCGCHMARRELRTRPEDPALQRSGHRDGHSPGSRKSESPPESTIS